MAVTENNIIGKVSATQKCPSSSDEFTFWLGDDETVSPFDLVAAPNTNGSVTVGVIREIHHITESPNHIANYVSSNFGDLDLEPTTNRLGAVYVTVEVMNNDKEVYMPLRDGQPVRFATEEEIRKALGIDGIPEERRIPTGYLRQSNDTIVPVSLDSRFLIGPEGAHLNISGISGLATKTSFIMFLLQSIMQAETAKKTATIIFNVKGDDLLFIDKPSKKLESVKGDWERCGLQAKPFDNVRYFFPYAKLPDRGYANTWCGTEDIKRLFQEGRADNFIYTYKNDKEKIDLLLSNIDDSNMMLESIQGAIMSDARFCNISTWRELSSEIEQRCQAGQGQNTIPVQSWRRFQRLLSTTLKGDQGIFRDSLSDITERHQVHLSDKICEIRGGDTIVVDIAQLPEQQKCLVFGDVIRSVYKMKTDGDEGCPERIVIFVDELNKYAPSNVKGSPIIGNLIEIAERGRSLGIVLFSAEQFRSAVHDRVIGNCATNVYGRTNGVEIATSDYRHIPKSFTNMMTRLSKGQLIVQHPIFRSMIKIAFPRPSYHQPSDEK